MICAPSIKLLSDRTRIWTQVNLTRRRRNRKFFPLCQNDFQKFSLMLVILVGGFPKTQWTYGTSPGKPTLFKGQRRRQWGWSCTFWSLGGRGTDPEEGFPPARVNWVRGRARDTSVSLSSQLLSLRMAVAAGMFILWQFLLLCHDVNCLYFCLLIKCHLCACTCCAWAPGLF